MFHFGPARGREASKAAVGPKNAVARHDQRDRIGGQSIARRSGPTGSASTFGQARIGLRAASRNLSTNAQNGLCERTAIGQVNCRISTEIDVLALIIGDDALPEIASEALLTGHIMRRGPHARQQCRSNRRFIPRRQEGPTDCLAGAYQAEVAPGCFEGCIPYHSRSHAVDLLPRSAPRSGGRSCRCGACPRPGPDQAALTQIFTLRAKSVDAKRKFC